MMKIMINTYHLKIKEKREDLLFKNNEKKSISTFKKQEKREYILFKNNAKKEN